MEVSTRYELPTKQRYKNGQDVLFGMDETGKLARGIVRFTRYDTQKKCNVCFVAAYSYQLQNGSWAAFEKDKGFVKEELSLK
mgnify:FL=1